MPNKTISLLVVAVLFYLIWVAVGVIGSAYQKYGNSLDPSGADSSTTHVERLHK